MTQKELQATIDSWTPTEREYVRIYLKVLKLNESPERKEEMARRRREYEEGRYAYAEEINKLL